MKRRICIVTASRAEFGVMKGIIQDLKNDPDFELQLIVTGAHLSRAQGFTYDEILSEGIEADTLIEMPLEQTDQHSLVKAMSACMAGMADALQLHSPDIIVVLGDRYELLPICSAAVVMNIPIAHISGGDITEGAIDDQIRHAITKLAYWHFPATVDSARRIVQMGEAPDRVFVVGEPGLDAIRRMKKPSRHDVATDLGLDENSNWILLTYHPETTNDSQVDMDRVQNLLRFFSTIENLQVVVTGANADSGGMEMNEYVRQAAAKTPTNIRFFMSLGHLRYIRILHHVQCMVGNSSSGIIEAPLLKIPVLNIGERQKGRFMCRNIVSCDATPAGLKNSYSFIQSQEFSTQLAQTEAYYGDGYTTERIVTHLRSVPLGTPKKVFLEQ